MGQLNGKEWTSARTVYLLLMESCCRRHSCKLDDQLTWPLTHSDISVVFEFFPQNILIKLQAFNSQEIDTSSSAIAEGPRDASCQLKSCQLPRNSAETTWQTDTGAGVAMHCHLRALCYNYLLNQPIFTVRCYACAVPAMGLCLSVCLSQVGVLLKRLNVGSHKQHHMIDQGL